MLGLISLYLWCVDDTLILCGTVLDHLRLLRCLFLCFGVVSGLKINLAKLELVSVGIVNNVEGLAKILVAGSHLCLRNT
jgi:hypothetical protein